MLPGCSAEDARWEKALESALETLENDLAAFKDALDGKLEAPDEVMGLLQMMWAKWVWPRKERGPVSAQEELIVSWLDRQMQLEAERMAEKACDRDPDDYREDREIERD